MPKISIQPLAELFRAKVLSMLKKEGLIDDDVISAMIFGTLKATLTRLSKKEGTHNIQMSLDEINDLAGWMAAESNHAESQRKSDELGDLCDYFESLMFQVK